MQFFFFQISSRLRRPQRNKKSETNVAAKYMLPVVAECHGVTFIRTKRNQGRETDRDRKREIERERERRKQKDKKSESE